MWKLLVKPMLYMIKVYVYTLLPSTIILIELFYINTLKNN